MKDAVYRINRVSAGWMIQRDGSSCGPYELPEAAFHAAVAAAALAIKEGLDVTIALTFSGVEADSPAGIEDSEPSVQRSRYDFEA
jgi:hypothetical protein